jgi:hypothetical protein
MITGGCLCGKIRYEAEVGLFLAIRCHCRDCQYASGGEPAAVISLARGALRVQGEPRVYRSKADSGVAVFRSFCADCGTPLFAGNEKDAEWISIKLGSLDEPSRVRAGRSHMDVIGATLASHRYQCANCIFKELWLSAKLRTRAPD